MKTEKFSRRQFLELSRYTLGSIILNDSLSGELKKTSSQEPVASFVEVVEKDESKEGQIDAFGLPVILAPLEDDYFYNREGKFEILSLGGKTPVRVDYRGVWTLKTFTGESFSVALLPHLTGSKHLPLAILETSRGQKLYREVPMGEKEQKYSFTYTAESEIYPNKINNILEALAALADYQEKNGPFKKGETYSYWQILNIHGRDYKLGKNSGGALVKAGGICATASTLSKTLILSGATITERFMHPSHSVYWVSPLDSRISVTGSDATIGMDGGGKIYDLKWQMPADAYIRVDAAVMPRTGAPFNADYDPADARLLFTLSLSSEKPEGQAEKLAELQDAYSLYRLSGHLQIDSLLKDGGKLVASYPFYSAGLYAEIAENIFPEERTANFREELEAQPFLRELVELKELINGYAETVSEEEVASGVTSRLGGYLKETAWYERKKAGVTSAQLAKIDSALTSLDRYTYVYYVQGRKAQAIQCVGWAGLLSVLGYEASPRRLSGQNIKGPTDLVPEEIRNMSPNVTMKDYKGGLTFFGGTKLTIEDVQVGDLFIRYETKIGHVGAVVGEKMVDGKKILLVSDANRQRDGRIRIFEVDAVTFDAVFAPYPYKKVLVR